MDHNWAPWTAKQRSYELAARYVFPKFQALNVNREASIGWVKSNKEEFTTQVRAAVGARIVQHIQEKGTENIRPEIVALIAGQAPTPEKAD
jgi:limonene 1,2-monooxygenase